MFDQSFSAKNFRKIFDYENRKGVYLEGRYFPDLIPLTNNIKELTAKLREHRKRRDALPPDEFLATRDELYSKRRQLKADKDSQLMSLLDQVSGEITGKGFELGLEAGHVFNGKQVYTSKRSPASFFALKQLQYSIRRLYKVRQSNRHHIVCQLREVLADKMRKYILRTDFSGFYENVRRDALLKQLSDDSLLTHPSKTLIKRVLREYGDQSGEAQGLPRGIGVSAYLAELYMRRFDEVIRSIPGVLYYARYVDDVFIVFIPRPNENDDRLSRLVSAAIQENTLIQNLSKTSAIHLNGSSTHSLDFLGYKFTFGNGVVGLTLTDAKISRYQKRVTLAFDDYRSTEAHNLAQSRELLIKRIRFLTGNTRLVNNKRRAATGIYFTNSLLTSDNQLADLDKHLAAEVALLPRTHLKRKLSSLSFTEGFRTKRYHRFSANSLVRIVKAWKYAT